MFKITENSFIEFHSFYGKIKKIYWKLIRIVGWVYDNRFNRGIASGKTTVSNYLKTKGYRVYDADIIAREIFEKKRSWERNYKRIRKFNIINE